MAGHKNLLLSGTRSNLILLGKRFAAHERRHERFPILDHLRGSVVHGDGRISDVVLCDVSRGGVSYWIAPQAGNMKPGSKVILRFTLGDTNQTHDCSFTLRDRRVDERGYFRHGLEVIDNADNLAVLTMLEEFVRRKRIKGLSNAA